MIPDSLKYHISGFLSNVKRQTVELRPSNTQTSAIGGDMISVTLPQNAIVDLHSFLMRGLLDVSASTIMSPGVHSLVNRFEMEVNGKTVFSISEYARIFDILAAYQGQDWHTKQNVTNLGYPVGNFTGHYVEKSTWLGLSGMSTRYIDTGLLGSITLKVYLSGPEVLYKAEAGSDGPVSNWSLRDVAFRCSVVELPVEISMANQAALAAGNNLSIIVPNYTAYVQQNGSGSYTHNVQLNAKSINYILGTKYLDATSMINEKETKLATVAHKQRSAYFERDGSDTQSWHFTINGSRLQSYTPDRYDAWSESLSTLNIAQDVMSGVTDKISNIDDFLKAYWTCGAKMNIDSEHGERFISGLDTLGSNTQISFQTTGAGAANRSMLVVQHSSILQIGAGRQLMVTN